MRKTALILENDPQGCKLIAQALAAACVDCIFAEDVSGMWLKLSANPDILILDISSPDINGLELLRQLRRRSDIPLMIRSSRANEIERILGLEMGADDFMPKPCNLRELVARVRAMLRRIRRKPAQPNGEDQLFVFGAWTLNRASRELTHADGQRGALGVPGFALLSKFLEHPYETLSREQLLSVLNRRYDREDRIVDIHVSQIRRTLGKQADGNDYIETLRTRGYMFKAEVRLQLAPEAVPADLSVALPLLHRPAVSHQMMALAG